MRRHGHGLRSRIGALRRVARLRAGLVGGSIVSHAVLGAPDVIVLTLTELAEQVRRCTRVSEVPLVIDGDHGYGNALNVMRTVQELDYAGAAAVMIEDTLLPRPFGISDKPQLLPLDEALGKIKAAVAARENSDLLIVGRTSAASISGLPDALERLRAYEAAGVDALMLPGLRTREDLEAISKGVRLPLVIGLLPKRYGIATILQAAAYVSRPTGISRSTLPSRRSIRR